MRVLFVIATLAFAATCSAGLSPVKTIRKNIYQDTLASSLGRITGGKTAKRHQFPYQASIQVYFRGQFRHHCGGTLISESRVLTAAHCTFNPFSVETTRVVLGLLVQDETHPDVQVKYIKQLLSHPGYPSKPVVAPNDIAVLVLRERVKLTPAVQIATLGNEEDCKALDVALISGWGALMERPIIYPRTLQFAEKPRISNEECAYNLVRLFGTSEPLDETQLCTVANPAAGLPQSICAGDSGGPLVRLANNRLIGVVSWGADPCETKDVPSVFTNVCSHLNFINSS